MSATGTFIQTERKSVVVRTGGWGEMEWLLMGIEFLFGIKRMF